jgi:hypothetical protein
MSGRTFVIGDVHGERAMLAQLLAALPFIAPDDALVFLGDYLDRGPDSRGVIELLRRLPEQTAGQVVCLRGNHEDALLKAIDDRDPSFILPPGNGVAASYRAFIDEPQADPFAAEHVRRYFEPAQWLPARGHRVDAVAAAVAPRRPRHLRPRRPRGRRHDLGRARGVVARPRCCGSASPTSSLGYGGPPLVFGHTRSPDLPPPEPRAPRRGPRPADRHRHRRRQGRPAHLPRAAEPRRAAGVPRRPAHPGGGVAGATIVASAARSGSGMATGRRLTRSTKTWTKWPWATAWSRASASPSSTKIATP